jgi:ribosomal protein L37E
MVAESEGAVCARCSALWPSTASACPECGWPNRIHRIHERAVIQPQSRHALRARSPGKGKWLFQRVFKEEFFRVTKRWHLVSRLFDRTANWYVEHIVDRKSGKIVRHVEEDLSSHQGHGSDRKRRQQPAGKE